MLYGSTLCFSHIGNINSFTGTRFPHCRDQNSEENVVAEHEDQTDRFGNPYCIDPHHRSLRMPWF